AVLVRKCVAPYASIPRPGFSEHHAFGVRSKLADQLVDPPISPPCFRSVLRIQRLVPCDPQREGKERALRSEPILGHRGPSLVHHDPRIHAGDHAIAPPDPEGAESHESPDPRIPLVVNSLRKDGMKRPLA